MDFEEIENFNAEQILELYNDIIIEKYDDFAFGFCADGTRFEYSNSECK